MTGPERQADTQRYNQLCSRVSEQVTRTYSVSFRLATALLGKSERQAIYSIYGFVRVADEIVDTFDRTDTPQLLQEFRQDTHRAIKRAIGLNPILHSFAQTVNYYGISLKHIEAFFASMQSDISKKRYNKPEYERYISGSAEAVGLMCLRVFCASEPATYSQLASGASHLGSAFQKINFLRGVGADFYERGRIYFPDVSNIKQFNNALKQRIEADILADLDLAKPAINALPSNARIGVACAYLYQQQVLKSIQKHSAADLVAGEVRIPVAAKIYTMVVAVIRQGLLKQKL